MPTKIPIFDFLRFIYVNIHTFYSAQLRIQIKNLNRDKIINGDSNYILNKEKNHSNCLFFDQYIFGQYECSVGY